MDIYFDGGCRPNPGAAVCCVLIEEEELIFPLGQGTNNTAEWEGLLMAVAIIRERNLKNVVLKGDSKVVINQAKGLWKCNEALSTYLSAFRELEKDVLIKDIQYVPRDKNLAGHVLERYNAANPL